MKPVDSGPHDTIKPGEQGKELQTQAEQKRQKAAEHGGAGDGGGCFWILGCQDFFGLANPEVCQSSEDAGLRIGTEISFT